ncbi:FAD-dependent 5-carboxymethylaminomethyl-2-thiouridine(34) oxidoreductase MnmC [Hyphomonas johnsonii]|uniref:tRNA 5-methylaminomethyl-2-thiouridine biosynthesis bifunctional protein MnmC n=1 Tax=Hyphomonas johnsonii MHS-2 TaxID=1280950 RepID=A0A059FP08_9PROT|nr:FAD-dependent 5-carboxymethylaminomethyl-2-thiouridine(34) oxidoreductase MnmC [Hyphomonas johnsonii]KCZ92374.1 FAD dependent oxidoreductase domain-containing protein [Hyphomonas johnsonii MHS-2]
MTRLLTHPDIDWRDDGTPVARGHDDVYFTAGDGLAESRAVFLAGCGLPDAWAGRDTFTVAETGFGTGLNFLALWQLWEMHRPAPAAWLHFVSFEAYPLAIEDAAQALGNWPELEELAGLLVARWPAPVKGVRRMVWPDAGISLTLHLGDIRETLPASRFRADAWFLDGFSPAKNEDMWAAGLYPELASHSAPGARLGTFTVAGAVRRGLAEAGFEVTRQPGHGRKRERLEATLTTPTPPLPDPYALTPATPAARRVAIIGAGIAGAGAARALVDAGAEVTVFDRAPAPATGASGNRLALLMPRLDAADTVQARLLVDAYLAARATYDSLPGVTLTDVRQVPKDPADAARFAKVLADPPLPLEDLEALRDGGLLHKNAMILRPAELVPALLAGADLRLGTDAHLDLAARTVNGEPFDAIILATAMATAAILPWLGLEARLGQVEWVGAAGVTPPDVIASGSYAIADGPDRLWGATFEPFDGEMPEPSDRARQDNADALARLSPWWIRDTRDHAPVSRASLRATTPDRLPLVGAVPDEPAARAVFDGVKKGRPADADAPVWPGIFMVNGLGARGFTWGPWAGGILAALVLGGPAPAEASALQAVSPMRLVLRALKRSGG